MITKISFGKTIDARKEYKQLLTRLLEMHQIKNVCDVGGGANPLLKSKYIHRKDIDYAILDISATELDKAPKEYKKILADISAQNITVQAKFDLVFSKMVAEHINDAEQFHKNVLEVLSRGGLAVHFFPTLYTLPFLVNRIFPEWLNDKLLNYFSKRDSYQKAKFPAYYRWCRGPISSQIQKFTDLGYEVVEYRGYLDMMGITKN